jgi:hypothetical protein
MLVDIVSLVRDGLLKSGCDESQLGDFDGHSTISMDFDGYPSLLVNVVDEDVWIWSQICEDNGSFVANFSEVIMEHFIKGCSFSRTGQLQLNRNDGFIELRGIVHPSYLENGERFSEALQEFFNHQDELLQALR